MQVNSDETDRQGRPRGYGTSAASPVATSDGRRAHPEYTWSTSTGNEAAKCVTSAGPFWGVSPVARAPITQTGSRPMLLNAPSLQCRRAKSNLRQSDRTSQRSRPQGKVDGQIPHCPRALAFPGRCSRLHLGTARVHTVLACGARNARLGCSAAVC